MDFLKLFHPKSLSLTNFYLLAKARHNFQTTLHFSIFHTYQKQKRFSTKRKTSILKLPFKKYFPRKNCSTSATSRINNMPFASSCFKAISSPALEQSAPPPSPYSSYVEMAYHGL